MRHSDNRVYTATENQSAKKAMKPIIVQKIRMTVDNPAINKSVNF